MSTGPTTAASPPSPTRDETLETSRLLVEFLHASYATRRMDSEGDSADASVRAEERGTPDGVADAGAGVADVAVGAADAAVGAAGAAPARDEPPQLGERPALTGGTAPSPHAIRAAIHVYQHGDRTVSQLAAGLGISLGWASRVADELVDRGHAVRERDPNDRRVVRLRMTEASLAEIERAYRWRGDAVARALEAHSPAERAAIRAFLRRVTDELTLAAGLRPPGHASAGPGVPAVANVEARPGVAGMRASGRPSDDSGAAAAPDATSSGEPDPGAG